MTKPKDHIERKEAAANSKIGKKFTYRGAYTPLAGKVVTVVNRNTLENTVLIRAGETVYSLAEWIFPFLCTEVNS